MGLLVGSIITLCASVYYIVVYVRFESRIKRKKSTLSQSTIKGLFLKTRITGLIAGIGASFIIPISSWGGYLVFLSLWMAFSVWTFSKATQRGIAKLKRENEIE